MKETTQEKILEAALKLFSEKGFLGATTKEIAKRAGISEVTLFRYFKTKEQLFIQVLEYYSFLPRLKEVLEKVKDDSLEIALESIAQNFLEVLRTKKALIQIIQSEIFRYPEIIKKTFIFIIEKIFKDLALYFEDLQKKEVIKKEIPSILLAQAFLGLFFSYFDKIELKGISFFNIEEEKVLKIYIEIFLKGVLKKD